MDFIYKTVSFKTTHLKKHTINGGIIYVNKLFNLGDANRYFINGVSLDFGRI